MMINHHRWSLVLLLAFVTVLHCDEDGEPLIKIVDDQRNDLPVQTITVEDDVYALDDNNYQNFIEQHRVALVEFYAPWCGHCKSLAPEYSAAAKMLADDKIALAKIDGTVYSELARSHDIQGYPTMFVYLNGNKIEYDGPRTAQGIVDHMRNVADPNYQPPAESVITLTGDNFDSTLRNESLILIEFYAPWCGHCKRLKPEYERAARRLSQTQTPIKLAKVDATVEKEIAARFDVTGYPTLIIFRAGGRKRQQYNGPRDENGIVEYMKSMQKSPSKVVHTREQLRRQLRDDVPTIVGLFDQRYDDNDHDQSSPMYDLFIDVAYNQFDAANHFVHVETAKLVDELKQKPNTLLLFLPLWFKNKYEPNFHSLSLDESTTSEQVLQFIANHSAPLVGFRNGATYSLYADKYPLVVVYYDVDFSFDHRKQTQLTLEQVQKAAATFRREKDRLHFVIAREQDNEQELADLRLDDSGEDVNVAYFVNAKRRYTMPPTDRFDAQAVIDFVRQIQRGEIEPIIRSAPAPASNPVRNLWTVVGETFDEIILRSGKDSLIEFYAPWCGHCRSLEPIYRQLAANFAVESDAIRIAKIDATTNDFPEQFAVSGFPTIYFVRANDPAHPIAYDGDRSLNDLTKFVHDHLHGAAGGKDEL